MKTKNSSVVSALYLATQMSIYAIASQVGVPSRALLPKLFGVRSTRGEEIRIFEKHAVLFAVGVTYERIIRRR